MATKNQKRHQFAFILSGIRGNLAKCLNKYEKVLSNEEFLMLKELWTTAGRLASLMKARKDS